PAASPRSGRSLRPTARAPSPADWAGPSRPPAPRPACDLPPAWFWRGDENAPRASATRSHPSPAACRTARPLRAWSCRPASAPARHRYGHEPAVELIPGIPNGTHEVHLGDRIFPHDPDDGPADEYVLHHGLQLAGTHRRDHDTAALGKEPEHRDANFPADEQQR